MIVVESSTIFFLLLLAVSLKEMVMTAMTEEEEILEEFWILMSFQLPSCIDGQSECFRFSGILGIKAFLRPNNSD